MYDVTECLIWDKSSIDYQLFPIGSLVIRKINTLIFLFFLFNAVKKGQTVSENKITRDLA